MGIKGIAAAFDVSRNTVRKYVRLWQDSSLTIEQLLALPEHPLREMFIPKGVRHREPSPRQAELEALLPEYAARLSRKGVTVKSLYEEYRQTHPDGIAATAQIVGNLSHLLVDDYRKAFGVMVHEDVDQAPYHRTPVEIDKRLGELNPLLNEPRALAGGNNSVVHSSAVVSERASASGASA